MLRKFNKHLDEIVFLDFGSLKYSVNKDLNVYLIKNNSKEKLTPIEKNGEVFITVLNEDIRLANIINFAFKGKVLAAFDDLKVREIKYLDGNKKNIHPSNLIWGNSNAPEINGFRLIPGASLYKINRDGVIIGARGFIISNYTDRDGYICVGFNPDVGPRRCIGVHRLVALAFLDIPLDFYKKDINHKDCNPKNNNVDNLEWSSRKENMLHAVENGLTKGNKILLVRNYLTGIIREFYSYRHCERSLGLKKGVPALRCKSKGRKVFPDFNQYCLKEDNPIWDNPKLDTNGFPSFFKISDNSGFKIVTGRKQLASILNLYKHNITELFRHSNKIEYNGKIIERLNRNSWSASLEKERKRKLP